MSAYPKDKKPFAWVVLPLHYTLKIGGQSGERSQRAAKRRIYSPNRLLNGIPTQSNWLRESDSNRREMLMRHLSAPLDYPAFKSLIHQFLLIVLRKVASHSTIKCAIECSFNGRRCRVQISTCIKQFKILLRLPHGA